MVVFGSLKTFATFTRWYRSISRRLSNGPYLYIRIGSTAGKDDVVVQDYACRHIYSRSLHRTSLYILYIRV